MSRSIVCQNLVSQHTTTTTLKLRVAAQDIIESSSSSFSSMSAESLDLCTENLGSESGSDIVTTGDINMLSNPTRPKDSLLLHHHQKTNNNTYPPPLTTIKNLQMRRHREGGRLIIEAVHTNSYLQAERTNGRLRLCFINHDHDDDDDDDDDGDDENVEPKIEEELCDKEMKMEKYHQRLISRCHNTTTSSSNWKPALWVASS